MRQIGIALALGSGLIGTVFVTVYMLLDTWLVPHGLGRLHWPAQSWPVLTTLGGWAFAVWIIWCWLEHR